MGSDEKLVSWMLRTNKLGVGYVRGNSGKGCIQEVKKLIPRNGNQPKLEEVLLKLTGSQLMKEEYE
jgi:hypothetical protein